MLNRLAKLATCTRGATAIEYGLILALIFVAIIGSVSALGGGTAGAWTNISTKVGAQLPGG
jgi:pilus assembly protein Flp/PilA